MTFDQAFERLIGHERGLSMDPKDRGNWTGGAVGRGELKGTKYGISIAAHPGEDIQGMTLARAKQIYRRDYWGPAGCDAVPEQIKFDLFDMAVNAGVRPAIRALQKAVGETEDGILGPLTLQAVQSMEPLRVFARFNGARAIAFTEAKTWAAHGRGWTVRLGENLLNA